MILMPVEPDIQVKLHTVQHIFLQLLKNEYGVKKVKIRFKPRKICMDVQSNIDLTERSKESYEQDVQKIIDRATELKKYFVKRDEVEEGIDMSEVPKEQENIRIVEIVGFNKQACIGNHVENTKEIGKFRIITISKLNDDVYRFNFTVDLP